MSDRRTFDRVHDRLAACYGPPRTGSRGDAVGVLVATILSQNTSAANSTAGYRRLRKRLDSWDSVADARVSTIERCIRVSGLSRTKAPRIRAILRQLRDDRGRIGLDFLADWNPDDAYDYLTALDGVGPKTALCVLLFALDMPVFPVDTHIFRIARRLGVLDESVLVQRAHEILTPMIRPGLRHALHLLLIRHGRATCRARNPRCDSCCLLRLCPTGKSLGAGADV